MVGFWNCLFLFGGDLVRASPPVSLKFFFGQGQELFHGFPKVHKDVCRIELFVRINGIDPVLVAEKHGRWGTQEPSKGSQLIRKALGHGPRVDSSPRGQKIMELRKNRCHA